MAHKPFAAVTGAFGFTGHHIAQKLLSQGNRIITLTGQPDRPHPLSQDIQAYPYHFENPSALAASLDGVDTLYNTYWIRFPYGNANYQRAVANTRILIEAAKAADVQRLIHISITNASPESPFPYFQGKGLVERAVRESGLSYIILRPAVLFGQKGILINNIAYLLKRTPVFAIPGSGDYKLQPIFVKDLANLAVCAAEEGGNRVIDAIGPETFTFLELLRMLDSAVDGSTRLIHLPPSIALLASRLLGILVQDVVLTRDELDGLMAGLLCTESPSVGTTRLSDWVRVNADSLGASYQSELERHYRSNETGHIS